MKGNLKLIYLVSQIQNATCKKAVELLKEFKREVENEALKNKCENCKGGLS